MIIRPNNGIFQQLRINIVVSSALPKIQQFVESKSAQQSFCEKTYPSTLQPTLLSMVRGRGVIQRWKKGFYHRSKQRKVI